MDISEMTASRFSKSGELSINETRKCVQRTIGKNTPTAYYTTESKPFLYKTVEELSEVKSTQFWKNDNVRVLGRIFLENDNSVIKATLISPLTTSEKSSLKLDMDAIEHRYSRGNLVEVFGYFVADLDDGPLLKALFINPANGVNIQSHYKVIKLRNMYVPDYND